MVSDEVPIPDPAIGIGVVLGADIEAEDPHTHALTPGGILRDEDIILREPTGHLSADASTVIVRRIRGYRSISGPRHWYERLPAEVRTLVNAVGVGGLIPFDLDMAQWRATQLYLLGAISDAASLEMVRKNTVGLYILWALVHLPRVVEYNWGGASLATLYCYMSLASR
ncbi:hypothetical protein ACSBR2_040224 [Camellia fascicularis]